MEIVSKFSGGVGISRRTAMIAVLVGILWLTAGPISPPDTPSQSGDTYLQDFEKKGVGRELDNWNVVKGKGYPHYNWPKVRWAADTAEQHNARSGHGYLVMRTMGGNVAFETDKNFLTADPEKSYLLRGWFKTAQAKNNRTYLSLHWLDQHQNELEIHKSTLMPPATEWTEITMRVEKIKPQARYVQIRLNYEGPDVRGDCWFDDIEFARQAKILVDTHKHPGNVYEAHEKKEVTLSVPSFQSPYTLEYSIRTLDGQVTQPLQTVPLESGQSKTIELPLNGPGYYELDIRVQTAQGARSHKITPILVTDDALLHEGKKDFGLVVNPYLTGHELGLFYSQVLGADSAKIVLRDARSARGSGMNHARLLELVKGFRDKKIERTAIVGRPHDTGGDSSSTRDLDDPYLSLITGRDWEAQLRFLIKEYGVFMRDWQFVREGDAATSNPAAADEILSRINDLIKAEELPLSIGAALTPDTPAELLKTPRFFSIDTTDTDLLENVPSLQKRFHYTMSVRRLQAGDRMQAMTDQMAHMMQRCIAAKKAGVPRIYWELQGDPLSSLLDSDGLPLPSFLALRTINHLLSGAEYQNKHIFPSPIRDVVFKRGNETLVAFWSEQGTVPLDMYLGQDARIIDCFGRIQPMSPHASLRVGPVPMFLIGINTEMIDTHSSLRFDDESLQLRGTATVRKLLFQNHFQTDMKDVRISVVRITDPRNNRKNWFIQPTTISSNNLPPQEKLSEPVEFILPAYETEGEYTVLLHLSFRTDRKYEAKLLRRLRVGSPLKVEHRIVSGVVADTRRLQIEITNEGDRKVDLKAMITLPDLPTLESSIAGLDVKKTYDQLKFNLPNYDSLRGRKVRIKVFEPSGDLFTNKEFVLE